MTRDEVIADHFAAALLMMANERGERGVLRADTETLLSFLIEFGDWAGEPTALEAALEVLNECGLGRSSNEEFWERFHRIDYTALKPFVELAHKERLRMLRELERMNYSGPEDQIYPTWEALRRHRLLERYHDFGDTWLRRRFEKLRLELAEESKPVDKTGSDEAGTGNTPLAKGFELSEEKRDALQRLIVIAEGEIERLDAPNATKAQARAYILAVRALADAPEPDAELIWKLLNRASLIAGIASLLVSVLALFK